MLKREDWSGWEDIQSWSESVLFAYAKVPFHPTPMNLWYKDALHIVQKLVLKRRAWPSGWVLALHAGSWGFDSHRGHMSERFFRSNRPGYPHPVSSELEKSGIRVAVGDCSVTELRRGVHLIKPAKLCMCTQNTTNTTRTDARRRVCGAMVPYRCATPGTSLRELEYTHTTYIQKLCCQLDQFKSFKSELNQTSPWRIYTRLHMPTHWMNAITVKILNIGTCMSEQTV